MGCRMSKFRRPLFGAAALAGLLLIFSLVNSLATNVASSTRHWPGPLGLIPRYPWWAVLVLFMLTLFFTMWAVFTSSSGPIPVSNKELLAAEGRLREHVDNAGIQRSSIEDRATCLPPYPRALLVAAGEDREAIWKAISGFADDTVIPQNLAREWSVSTPVIIDTLPTIGRLVIAELLLAYGQPAAAVEHMRKAVHWGATPRPFWLVRMAQVQMTPDEDEQPRVDRLLAEAEQVDANYPLVMAMKAIIKNDWSQALRSLEGWSPPTAWEQETALLFRNAALLGMDRLDDAIAALDGISADIRSASASLQLAQLLRTRAVKGTGDSDIADAARAVEVAISARNSRRTWRSDSAEAVAVAAEAAVIAGNHQQVWSLCRPAPDGEATPSEAADPRVLPVAAMGAVLTRRFAQARALLDTAPAGYARLCIEAELASADHSEATSPMAVEAWRATLRAASSDEEKLRALRGLAMEGASDDAALEEFRAHYPDAVTEIETLSTIAAVSGPDSDERLRALEPRSSLASVRRADMLRHDDPEGAAEILIEANTRWRNPRLLLLALDCCQDAGRWEQASQIAQDALTQIGPRWAGRATILRRLIDIQLSLIHI